MRKLGEDVTRTMEAEPRRWKVVETVREKFTCRDCEKISQGAGPVSSDPAGLGWTELAGDDRVREVRPASAAEPSGRTLRAGRRAHRAVDHGRRRRRRLLRTRSAAPPCRGSRDGRGAAPR